MNEKFDNKSDVKTLAIIGAGWYGCHLALALRKQGHSVTLYEKNPFIFSEVSGKCGVRLHRGPHYPRSPKTRENCQRGLDQFIETYPNLVVEHEYSIYALGNKDANGNPPKVSQEVFESVGKECKGYKPVNPVNYGYTNLLNAYSVDEPSIVVGDRLREAFTEYLKEAGVDVICNYEITSCENKGQKTAVFNKKDSKLFDKVINTTSYQAMVSKGDFPFEVDVVYQPCVVLIYEDNNPGQNPFSFTVMDGWFPCVMPYVDEDLQKSTKRKYMLYHAKWTPLMSCPTASEAHQFINDVVDEKFIQNKLKIQFEKEIDKFWPDFKERFKYIKHQATVLPKILTNREFRSAVTYEVASGKHEGMICMIPGKINNIFDVEREVKSLIFRQNLIETGNCRYVKGGVLDSANNELTEKVDYTKPNTCLLQSYYELVKESPKIPIYENSKRSTFWSHPDAKLPLSNSPPDQVPKDFNF
ncbi:MAG: FAD-dependent oxidoreductase [Tatlockia sp.]|nr:FAD-dependent oxidoreductase [Tatlockia sp.]